MKIRKFLLAWHLFALTFIFFLVVLFAIFPELEAFSFLTKRYGFIDIEYWDLYYLIFLAIAALFVNNLFIIITVKLFRRFKAG